MTRLFTQPKPLHLCLAIAIISLLACTKKESLTPVETQDNTLVFQTFLFEKKNNPQLKEDVVFDIQDNIISAPLKHYYFNAVC